jgi:ribosomal protein S18 acetylase RimI-like enzyme
VFEKSFELISKENPAWGQAAILPWDMETFGFPVADFQIDYSPRICKQREEIIKLLKNWAEARKVELIGATVPAGDISRISFIQSLGFSYIETTLSVYYLNVKSNKYPASCLEVVIAGHEHIEAVVDIAGKAFVTGRYHSDKSFPRHLADKRYRDWVQRAFKNVNNQIVLAGLKDNQVCAFSVIEIKGGEGYLHLNAVDPARQGQKIGLGLVASTLQYFQNQGVDCVRSKISVTNVRALNLHSRLGAGFDNPQVLLHLHLPSARNLLK